MGRPNEAKRRVRQRHVLLGPQHGGLNVILGLKLLPKPHTTSFRLRSKLCEEGGLSFIPMVVEAVGGSWGKSARCVWSSLAKSSALANGELETEDTCAVMLQQRLSMILHKENARACLRRLGQ